MPGTNFETKFGLAHMQENSINDRRVIADMEQSLAQAHVDLNLGVIDDILHENYIIVQPGGAVETKPEVISSYKSGDRIWTKAAVDQLDVRQYNDTGIVIGRWIASGRNGMEPFDYQARFLSVWIRQDGRWKNIAYQSTEITAPEK